MIHSDAQDNKNLRTSADGNLPKHQHVFSFNQTLEQLLQSEVYVLQGRTRLFIVLWEKNNKTSTYLKLIFKKASTYYHIIKNIDNGPSQSVARECLVLEFNMVSHGSKGVGIAFPRTKERLLPFLHHEALRVIWVALSST